MLNKTLSANRLRLALLRRDSGSALIYLLIIVGIFSILASAGGATYMSISELTRREQLQIDAKNFADLITVVYMDPGASSNYANCLTLINQSAPSLASEFTKLLANPTYQTSPQLTLQQPQVVGGAALTFVGPQVKTDILTVSRVSLSNIKTINASTDSYRVDVTISFAADSKGFIQPPAVIPFYIVTNGTTPTSCFATSYAVAGTTASAPTHTLQDMLCQMNNSNIPVFDPATTEIGSSPCIQ